MLEMLQKHNISNQLELSSRDGLFKIDLEINRWTRLQHAAKLLCLEDTYPLPPRTRPLAGT